MAGAMSCFAMAGQPDHGIPDMHDAHGQNSVDEHVIRIERADKGIHKISIPFKPQQIKHTDGGVLISGEKDGVYHDMLPLKLEPGERLIDIEPAQKEAVPAGFESLPRPVPVGPKE
jgi:hypothetical protein